MTRLEFRNCLNILHSIDRHELVEAGAIGADDFPMWNLFVNHPVSFFVLCEDARAEKIWRVIERRAGAQIDWNDNIEAHAAIKAGKLPAGYSINAAGVLVIPDEAATDGRRQHGSFAIIAHFDEVVTVSGRVVKSRDGFSALKAARAL